MYLYCKVWSIRVDVHVLDHDGGLMDAIVLAAMAGLLHFRCAGSHRCILYLKINFKKIFCFSPTLLIL